jgi:hypothetical protein
MNAAKWRTNARAESTNDAGEARAVEQGVERHERHRQRGQDARGVDRKHGRPVISGGAAPGRSRFTPASWSAANHSAANVSAVLTTIAPIAPAGARKAAIAWTRRGLSPSAVACAA